MRIFQLNDEEETIEELDLDKEVDFKSLLQSDFVLVIFDEIRTNAFIWYGSKATTRMRFITARKAVDIRSTVGLFYKPYVIIEEGEETPEFCELIGDPNLSKEIEWTAERKKNFEHLHQLGFVGGDPHKDIVLTEKGIIALLKMMD